MQSTTPIHYLRLVHLFILLTVPIYGRAQVVSKNYDEQMLDFYHDQRKINGTLITPRDRKQDHLPLIIFVHGSGPEDYSSSGNYGYLWEQFTKIGFACYSWNRAGVGGSEGKWYEQSVYDRAEEVIAAINTIKKVSIVDSSRIGLWGLSQAGWVMPIVAQKIQPDFVISVSPPVTTAFDQELHRVRSEMEQEGFSKDAINAAISYNHQLIKLIEKNEPYERFAILQKRSEGAEWESNVIRGDEMVYNYLKIVFTNDDKPNLSSFKCPVLAIWGRNDLVVPPDLGADQYAKSLLASGNKNVTIKIIPKADHTLTENKTGSRAETQARRERFKNEPEKIFAPGYVSLMVQWLQNIKLN